MDQSDSRRQSSTQNQPPLPITGITTFAGASSGAPPPMTASSPMGVVPSYHQAQPFYNQPQQQQLQSFWANQMREVEQTTDFKNYSLPLARIKKIMKADEDVRMISAEAPVIFAKACEMFILELTLRSWMHTEENKRRTLQKNDIAAAISKTDVFDFLVDIVPRDELKEEGIALMKPGIDPFMGSPADAAVMNPYYYVPPPQAGASGVVVGNPVDQGGAYGGGGGRAPVGYMPWQQPPPDQQGDS